MRFLGIDYGARRIGLSYGDDIRGLATPKLALTDAEYRNELDGPRHGHQAAAE